MRLAIGIVVKSKSRMISDVKIKGELLITDSGSGMELQAIPKWIEFMIWAGWMMRNANSDSRQIMVLLLPERIRRPFFFLVRV